MFPPALNKSALRLLMLSGLFFFIPASLLHGQTDENKVDFFRDVAPLIKSHCVDCHSGKEAEGEFDLLLWKSDDDAIKQIDGLEKFFAMVKSGQMPPKGERKITDAQKHQLVTWSSSLLFREAEKFAGDPGPIVLRRLSNAEYDYTVRDLTGLPDLKPTKEFPIDGAAGEGFTNTGYAQAMSPALMQKYFDAAKAISRHVVLLPSGLSFSPHLSERDRIDHYIRRIQTLYGKYSNDKGSSKVNLHGIQFETNGGGRLPLVRYLKASIEFRDIENAKITIDEFATKKGLSPKYLRKILQFFQSNSSLDLIQSLQKLWRDTRKPDDVEKLARAISQWQSRLWRFNSIGHLGKQNGPSRWMEPQNPSANLHSFVISPPAKPASGLIPFHLAGLSNPDEPTDVKWIRPRIVNKDNNEILLRDVAQLALERNEIRQSLLANTDRILNACRKVLQKISKDNKPLSSSQLQEIAKASEINLTQLEVWLKFLGIEVGRKINISGHFQNRIRNANGHDFIHGWGSHQTPSILASSSDQQVRIPGIMLPKSVVVHPSPTLFSGCVWQSPIDGEITLTAEIADQHPECGNGVEWTLNHETKRQLSIVWKGKIDTGKSSTLQKTKLKVSKGDLISFLVGPRDGSHACDLTKINLRVEHARDGRQWDLAKRLSKDIQSNPLSDQYGNEDVWHFVKGSWKDAVKSFERASGIPKGSVLDHWLESKDEKIQLQAQKQLVGWLNRTIHPPNPDTADAQLLEKINRLTDPLFSKELRRYFKPDSRFGPKGTTEWQLQVADSDLLLSTGKVETFMLPADWLLGSKILVDAKVANPETTQAVQLLAQFEKPNLARAHPQTLITIADNAAAKKRLHESFNEFRKTFPAAICYPRIVPVDEVVTLTLFHREDDWLQNLFLNEQEIQELNRLWDEFLFVAKEPLKKQVALEQIYQFATQDRPDLVNEFQKLMAPTKANAEEFQKRRKESQKKQLNDAIKFAEAAWRRPLFDAEIEKLNKLYLSIRERQSDHEKVMQMLVARILVSPDFLYRRESSKNGNHFSPISDDELAVRLSYFLWSTTPDRYLRQSAANNTLSDPTQLKNHVRRMLSDQRCRRLAIHFACQWLHLRDFDENNDKNEKLFPEFAKLRKDFYEETVLFFTQLFRENRSILEIIDADYAYINSSLAQHYKLKSEISSNQFHRVRVVDRNSRGGVLGMATFLASQSGASRTSPILRGTWISETLLGEQLPKPPADVPPLPETVPQGLTARQLIEKHSSVAACAKCHARIDPYGFALEQFDALGRTRPDKPNTQTTLFDGHEIDGFADLKNYILNHRREDFVRQFCKKLLGFALGREIQLSDEPLIRDMMKNLKDNDYRFRTAVETIVQSDQFLSVRDINYQR